MIHVVKTLHLPCISHCLRGYDTAFPHGPQVNDCKLRKQDVTKDAGVLAGIKDKVASFCAVTRPSGSSGEEVAEPQT